MFSLAFLWGFWTQSMMHYDMNVIRGVTTTVADTVHMEALTNVITWKHTNHKKSHDIYCIDDEHSRNCPDGYWGKKCKHRSKPCFERAVTTGIKVGETFDMIFMVTSNITDPSRYAGMEIYTTANAADDRAIAKYGDKIVEGQFTSFPDHTYSGAMFGMFSFPLEDPYPTPTTRRAREVHLWNCDDEPGVCSYYDPDDTKHNGDTILTGVGAWPQFKEVDWVLAGLWVAVHPSANAPMHAAFEELRWWGSHSPQAGTGLPSWRQALDNWFYHWKCCPRHGEGNVTYGWKSSDSKLEFKKPSESVKIGPSPIPA